MRICTNCGTEQEEGAFCMNCGASTLERASRNHEDSQPAILNDGSRGEVEEVKQGDEGEEKSRDDITRERTKKGCLGCLSLVVVVAIIAGVLAALGGNSSDSPDKIEAWVVAQQFVEGELRSPGSADYGSVWGGDYQDPDVVVTDLGNDEFRVSAWVDAENAFGAKIRSYFVCELKYIGDDRWRCTSLTFLE